MSPDDRDSEDFFEALAGRADSGPGPAALREALAAQARTLRQAEDARAEQLSEEERSQMAVLKERLRAAGVFRGVPPAAVRERSMPWLRWLSDLLQGASWRRPAAIAAGLVVAGVLVLRLALPERDDSGVIRGAPTPAIVVLDPAGRTVELERSLAATGATVVAAKISEREWSLVVDVPDSTRVAAVQQLLRDAGFAVVGMPPYELAIRAPK